MNGVIYKFNSPSGKSYIGQTVNIKKRFWDHRKARSKSIFHRAVLKYGFDAFTIEILHSDVKSKDELNILETNEIMKNGTLAPLGYNMNTGGDSRIATEKSKMNMSQAHRGKPQKHKRKPIVCLETGCVYPAIFIAEKQLGIKEGHLCHVLNKPSRTILGMHFCTVGDEYDIGNAVYKSTEKQRVKCYETGEVYESLASAAKSLRPHAPNGRNIKIVLDNPNKTAFGFHWVTEHSPIGVVGEGRWSLHKRKVICVETRRVYDSLSDAAYSVGLKSSSSIIHAIRKKRTARGFSWAYYDKSMVH